MKYFFVLGINPTLSIAELAAVLDIQKAEILSVDLLVVETAIEIDCENLIKRLGGVVKMGVIREEIGSRSQKDILDAVIEMAVARQKKDPVGKFNFGFSDYGDRAFDKKDLGVKLKNHFKGKEISSRFVVSKEKNLSSVVVTQNKLLKRGIEINLAEQGEKVLIGETLAVQPFKDLSRRDFGRPARDDQSGMLPPKLAQIMINLAQVKSENSLILDPFCGSGTIITEAMLLGYRNLFGSDISLKASDDTRANVSWTRDLYKLENIKAKIITKNATKLSQFIKKDSVDAIITEPYLGPQRGRIDFNLVMQELEQLYSRAIKEFREILKKDGRIVMVWPSFYGERPITPDYSGFKIVNMIPGVLLDNNVIQQTERETIVYGRINQKVHREIVVLEKE